MKKYVEAAIVENTPIASGVYRLTLREKDIAAAAKPGQFVNLYTGQKDMLLPRPISIHSVSQDTITLVYQVAGAGTKYFSGLKEGGVKILGPLGNGFAVPSEKARHVVIGGGIGIPPLFELAKNLKGSVDVVLGYRLAPLYLLKDFQKEGFSTLVATEDGSMGTKGNVLDVLKKMDANWDYLYACGPSPMLKALDSYAVKNKIIAQLSLEARMACGIGACVGCTVTVRKDGVLQRAKVCKDGPVFSAGEVVWE